MDIQYYIGNKKVTWDTITLQEFTNDYTPSGWEDVFEAAEEDVTPEISKLISGYASKSIVYPPMPFVFNAMDSLHPKDIKVVIIGQDPYINKDEAMGWSFSVPDGIKLPPSLRNIYKELAAEGYRGYKNRKTGDLTEWVDRGVFLYNSCLTVNKGDSGSHKEIWGEFTDMVINYLNNQDHIAWILLGTKAQKYARKLDKQRHGVYMAGHPSPLNRNGGFIGSGIFEEAEEYLEKHGRKFTWNLN
jgi:uracil-DNA glycosylase